MSLPNYTPSGYIFFGAVPWNNSYTDVRLYPDTETQWQGIRNYMVLESNTYKYVGRNRRLTVSIEADRMYHCNYCMYRNESFTEGWIYCFITDVKYINDNTTEVTLETDIFQTYLYGLDWDISACFVERETPASEDEAYMYTPEPDFPLVYVNQGRTMKLFEPGGLAIFTNATPMEDSSILQPVINPRGIYAKPCDSVIYKGTLMGANIYYIKYFGNYGAANDEAEVFINNMATAGASDSISCIITVPSFYNSHIDFNSGLFGSNSAPDKLEYAQTNFSLPSQPTSLDGYTPRHRKLFYYPYTFCKITDHAGHESEYRYELLGSLIINIKYSITPSCQAYAYPANYMGTYYNFDAGITVNCGSMCTWSNNTYSNWLGQNAGAIAITAAGIALAGYSGGTSITAGSQMMNAAARSGATDGLLSMGPTSAIYTGSNALMGVGASIYNDGASTLKGAGAAAAGGLGALSVQSKQPVTQRGSMDYSLSSMCGIQGVFGYSTTVKAEIAQQIDMWFDRWGYACERIKYPEIDTKPFWNYVKTNGASVRGLNGETQPSIQTNPPTPFTRGRGTPASALALIKERFDAGITFWHTDDIGNYSLNNANS